MFHTLSCLPTPHSPIPLPNPGRLLGTKLPPLAATSPSPNALLPALAPPALGGALPPRLATTHTHTSTFSHTPRAARLFAPAPHFHSSRLDCSSCPAWAAPLHPLHARFPACPLLTLPCRVPLPVAGTSHALYACPCPDSFAHLIDASLQHGPPQCGGAERWSAATAATAGPREDTSLGVPHTGRSGSSSPGWPSLREERAKSGHCLATFLPAQAHLQACPAPPAHSTRLPGCTAARSSPGALWRPWGRA